MTIAAGQTAAASDILQEHNADGTHGGTGKELTLPMKTTPATGQGKINYKTSTGKVTVGDGSAARDVVDQGFNARGKSTFGDGGATDYFAFAASTGTVQAFGQARWAKALSLMPGAWFNGATPGAGTILGRLAGYALTIGDSHLVSFEVPDDADISVNPEVKVLWAVDEAYATNSGEVQFQADWSANPMDGTEAVDSPTHTGQLKSGDQNIPSVALRGTVSSLGTIANLAAGDLVGIELSRVALDGGNNPTAEPVVYQVLVEYTADKLGS